MTSEVVIDVQSKEITIGLLEDGKLAEYQRERKDSSFTVGNIYLARVKKLMPGLNAAFIDVGHEKEGFIHYQDLGPQFRTLAKYVKQQISDRKHYIPLEHFKREPDINKDDTVVEALTVGQEILVQIAKEPISTKGPRLTCDLSLPGRFISGQGFGKHENQVKRREEPSQADHWRHPSEELRRDHTHVSAGDGSRRAYPGAYFAGQALGRMRDHTHERQAA